MARHGLCQFPPCCRCYQSSYRCRIATWEHPAARDGGASKRCREQARWVHTRRPAKTRGRLCALACTRSNSTPKARFSPLFGRLQKGARSLPSALTDGVTAKRAKHLRVIRKVSAKRRLTPYGRNVAILAQASAAPRSVARRHVRAPSRQVWRRIEALSRANPPQLSICMG